MALHAVVDQPNRSNQALASVYPESQPPSRLHRHLRVGLRSETFAMPSDDIVHHRTNKKASPTARLAGLRLLERHEIASRLIKTPPPPQAARRPLPLKHSPLTLTVRGEGRTGEWLVLHHPQPK